MPTNLPTILQGNGADLALVIGNGINRHGTMATHNSWDQLLSKVAAHCASPVKAAPAGTSLTEFYDILELKSDAQTTKLQAEFCALLKGWVPGAHHKSLMQWARSHNSPVLTTNFDDILAMAGDANFSAFETRASPTTILGSCYYAPAELADPRTGFGVWDINGMAKYHRSVRLGLRHYMGSLMRARQWLHRSGNRLFASNQLESWAGRQTWMQIIFSKPLLIIGLGIEENETFLRWLLLERARYLKEYESCRQKGWYVYRPDPANKTEAGKLYFLESVGFECVAVSSFDEIYDEPAWSG